MYCFDCEYYGDDGDAAQPAPRTIGQAANGSSARFLPPDSTETLVQKYSSSPAAIPSLHCSTGFLSVTERLSTADLATTALQAMSELPMGS
jgi:hypothetical protein